jgi:dolichol-phosphate mannosyltransferase
MTTNTKKKTSISVIVPTYKEEANVESLTRRLFAATRAANLDCELVLIDDESSGTPATLKIASQLAAEGYNIRVRVRSRGEGKGLSSAVLLGLREEAKNETMLVMDADLQHEPESVPQIVAPIIDGNADFAVGSRNVGGGVVEDWPLVRRVISWGATALAKPLTSCSDPMSGFFALPKSTLERAKYLNPMGYKIGLELMVRCRVQHLVEVPIRFRDREAGESKLTMKQNILYLLHLLNLYWFKYPVALVLFFIMNLVIGLVVAWVAWQMLLVY